MTRLLDAEDVIHQRLCALPATNREAAELARALVVIRQQIRREQMKPDAKPVDVQALEERKAKLAIKDAQFSEPE